MSAGWNKQWWLGACLLGGACAMAQAAMQAPVAAAAAMATTATPADLARQAGIPRPAVIAHRGASFYAPESTRAAYLLARELGADYLEMDLQRTRDGVLVVVHDDTLQRTSDVARRFPERAGKPVSDFTLAELKTLDAGSWFNSAYPDRARAPFKKLRILTLDEVIDIAEGNPARKPGLYIETKVPQQFPGIEKDLHKVLEARGWLRGDHRVVLQTFDKDSLALLNRQMPKVPKVLLLWVGEGSIEPQAGPTLAASGLSKSAWYALQQPRDRDEFARWLAIAKAGGAVAVGPSAALTEGGEQSYMDLVQPWMNQMAHEQGLLVHVYTVDAPVDFTKVMAAGVDGIFTNRAAELLAFYGRPAAQSVPRILTREGY
jgi:glycerophosphoryl diester phosphodiesterase